jgi:hypothetical protein
MSTMSCGKPVFGPSPTYKSKWRRLLSTEVSILERLIVSDLRMPCKTKS